MARIKFWQKPTPTQPQPARLFEEIASRQTAWDQSSLLSLLPSPDPVLRRLEEGGYQVLEQLTADAHVMSVVQTRKLGTLALGYQILPGAEADGSISPASQALHRALVEDLARLDVYSLLHQMLEAPLYGMQPFELIWEPREAKARLVGMRALPARWFGFDTHNQPRFLSAPAGFVGEELPFGKFLFARHFPSYDNPHGVSLLSRCLWPVTFKKGGIKFWVQLAEKYGMPFLVGTYPAGTTEAEQERLLSSLAKAVRDFVMIAPEGGRVELKEASPQSGSMVHQDLKDAMNDEISKVILGQNLTTEVKGGSYAASKTHAEVLATYQEADQRLVEATWNELFGLYQSLNDTQAKPPRFAFERPANLNQALAERDKVLTDQGLRFTKEYYLARYGLKPEDFDLAQD